MRLTVFAAAVAAALSVALSAAAQEQTDRTRAYVDAVSFKPSSDRSLARWNSDICVGAVGLSQPEAQALVDRISARAQSVGLDTGAPGCRANVMVIYAPDANAITRQIVDQRREFLGYYSDGTSVTAGREALEEFANTPRPIRWWHVSDDGAGAITNRPGAAMDRQGSGRTAALAAAQGSSTSAVEPDGSANDLQGVDAVRVSGSRMSSGSSSRSPNNMSYALVIVDAPRVAGLSPSAWMDYVAFVSLAQVDPEAQTSGYNTILNLFSTPQSTQTELSAWDDAYLKALYRARADASANRQSADIARRMARNVSQ